MAVPRWGTFSSFAFHLLKTLKQLTEILETLERQAVSIKSRACSQHFDQLHLKILVYDHSLNPFLKAYQKNSLSYEQRNEMIPAQLLLGQEVGFEA